MVRKLLINALVLSILAAVVVVNVSAADLAYGAGTVTCSQLNIRAEANTSAKVLATLDRGVIVVILEKTSATWYKVNYKGTVGFVSTQYLSNVLTAENFSASGTIVGSDINMRSNHSTSATSLGTFSLGTTMSVIGINEGWYKVKYQGLTGYIRSDYMAIVADQNNSGQKSTATSTSPIATTFGDKVVNFAMQYVGYDYVYGGAAPSEGFDCSGFTYYVYGQLGHPISRTASQQYANNGQEISKSQVVPGDLLFFSCDGSGGVSHVGIYIGNNQFVNAENHSAGVCVSQLDSSYWSETWCGAKRIA